MSLRVLALAFVALATASAAKTDVTRPLRLGMYSSNTLMTSALPLSENKVLVPGTYMSTMTPDIRLRPTDIPLTDSGSIYRVNRFVINPKRDYMDPEFQKYDFAIITLDRKIETVKGEKIPTIPKKDVTVTPGQAAASLRKFYPTTTTTPMGGYDLEIVDLTVVDSARCAEPCGATFTKDFICVEQTTNSEDSYSMPLENGAPLVVGEETVGIITPEVYCTQSSMTSSLYGVRKISTLGDFIQV